MESKLTLVLLGARHASGLTALADDDPDPPWMTIAGHSPRQRVLAFVERAQRLRARGAHAAFAVCDAERCVGIVVLARDQPAPDRAELGYWIGRAHRGQGYATAAARQLVSHGFGRMRLAVAFARCPSANPASARVVEKLGFRFAGLEKPMPEHSMSAGETIRRYEITRDKWLE